MVSKKSFVLVLPILTILVINRIFCDDSFKENQIIEDNLIEYIEKTIVTINKEFESLESVYIKLEDRDNKVTPVLSNNVVTSDEDNSDCKRSKPSKKFALTLASEGVVSLMDILKYAKVTVLNSLQKFVVVLLRSTYKGVVRLTSVVVECCDRYKVQNIPLSAYEKLKMCLTSTSKTKLIINSFMDNLKRMQNRYNNLTEQIDFCLNSNNVYKNQTEYRVTGVSVTSDFVMTDELMKGLKEQSVEAATKIEKLTNSTSNCIKTNWFLFKEELHSIHSNVSSCIKKHIKKDLVELIESW